MASSTFDPSCLEQLSGGVALRKPTAVDSIGGIFCHICQSTFSNKKDYDSHYAQHNLAGGNIVYTCVACRKQITGYPSFRNHCYLIHVVKNKFKCVHCSKSFSKMSILNGHIDVVHKLKFKCATCKAEFPSKKELQIHQIIHRNEDDKPPYECRDCGKTIDNQDMCELHIDEHCLILYPCPICNETAPNKKEAAKHLSKHFNEEPSEDLIMNTPQMYEDCSVDFLGGVLCCYCDELFKNRPEFDNHFTAEHEDKDLFYSCNICGKKYKEYPLFANHCYFHIAKDRFHCTECGKTFPRLSLLVLHTEAFHTGGGGGNGGGSPDKPFRCAQCGARFKSVRRLHLHVRVVHLAPNIQCAEEGCGMTFETPKDLILHKRHHEQSTRQNSCQHCGLQFTTLSSCEVHLDVHRKKQYNCPICARHYKEKYLLLKHIPQHFESVLHVCKTCGKVFNARYRLVEHSKTHSDLRTHICSYCGKGFMKAHQLEQHLNIHTGSRPYKCVVCPKEFASYPNLYKHLRRMHKIDKTMINKSTIEKARTMSNNVTEKTEKKSKAESGIDSTSSEISAETYSLAESDDSAMDGDPIGIDKDWCIDNQLVDSGLEYTDMLPLNDDAFDSVTVQTPTIAETSQTVVYPREYGPDFGSRVDMDEHYLPHIDPLLTIKNQFPDAQYVNTIDTYTHDPTPPDVAYPGWEPLITKIYHTYEDNDVNRISIMNTDIF